MTFRMQLLSPVVAAALALVAACKNDTGAAAAPSGAKPPVPTGALSVGLAGDAAAFDSAMSAFRTVSGMRTRQRLVVRDSATWHDLWAQMSATRLPQPPEPHVDFTNDMIVFASSGDEPTGGYDIAIDGVYDSAGSVYAAVHETSPGTRCVEFQMVTAPASAMLVSRREGSVTFSERADVRNCD